MDFWFGFVTGVLILSVLECIGLALLIRAGLKAEREGLRRSFLEKRGAGKR